MYQYRVFGYRLSSQIRFDELAPAHDDDEDDSAPPVRLTLAGVPEHILPNKEADGWIEATSEQCLFTIQGRGRILVSRGAEIEVDAASDSALDDLRPYLITCGLGTAAFQRGLLPLHLSAVMTPKGAWLFTGPSGAGKSTSAATLSSLAGWKLLGDDLATLDAKTRRLYFGVNKIKLWEDAAKLLGLDVSSLQRDFFRPHKYHIPIDPTGSISLDDIIGLSELKWGGELAIVPAKQASCFTALMNSIYPPFLAPFYLRRHEMQDSIAAMLPIPNVSIITRSRDQFTSHLSLSEMRKHIESTIS